MIKQINKALLSILSISFCLIFFAPDIPNAGAISLSDYIITLYNKAGGLPTEEINTIIQTDDGYIWLGSGTGLIRYNGISFETIADIDTEGFESSSVKSLLEDKSGVLWVGTGDRGLFTYKNGMISHIESSGLFSDSINSLILSPDGGIVVGSSSGCAKIVNGNVQPICDDVEPLSVSSLSLTPGGSLWIVSELGEIIQVFGNSVVFRAESSEFSEYKCLSVAAYDDSSVLFGTDAEALISLNTSDSSYKATIIETEKISGIRKILRDISGKTWLCTDSGIALYENGKVTAVNSESLLFCTDFFEDYEGNLWFVSTRKGIMKLTPSKFQNISLDGYVINSTIIYGSHLYAATDKGILILDINNKYSPIENELTQLLDGIKLVSLTVDSKNNLWICTAQKYGAICYDGDGWTIYNKDAGLSEDKASIAFELLSGDIAISSANSICIVSDGKISKKYTSDDGFNCTSVLSLCQDKDGTIWVGTDGDGIYKIQNDNISNLTTKNGLWSNTITAMRYDSSRDIIWVGALSRLCYIDSEGTINQTPLGNKSNIYDVLLNSDQELCILTSTEVIIADTESLIEGQEPQVRRLGHAEGLISNITPYSHSGINNGKLYISCYEGVNIIDTANIPYAPAPKIAVSAVIVDGVKHTSPDQIILNRKANRIVIEYALLSFTGQAGSVRYILDGHDKKYTTVLGSTQITYTNLGGGMYNFNMYGLNGDGVESLSNINIKISKEFSWYEIPYVWIAILIIATVVVMWGIRQYLDRQIYAMTKSHEKLKSITTQAMIAISSAVDAKDEHTINHSKRVAQYAAEIARRMGLSEEEQAEIYYSGLLHDIGKINLPSEILSKPEKLTDEEFELIKKYPERGGDLLKSITKMPMISEGARYHHEKFDGSGYAHGLKGDEIPLAGRIISAADAFDAMYSDRPYRKAKTRGEIAAEFISHSGKQFEPHIADIVINMINDGFEAKQ